MKWHEFESDAEECNAKVLGLLKEFNCSIEYDKELSKVILVDKDTKKFEVITAR